MNAEQIKAFYDALDSDEQSNAVEGLRRAGQDEAQIAMRRNMEQASTPGEKVRARNEGRRNRAAMLRKIAEAQAAKDGPTDGL